MGFNAAWFAKIAVCIFGALAVGFVGAVYVGAKLFEPEQGKIESRSDRSMSLPSNTAAVPEHAAPEASREDSTSAAHAARRSAGDARNGDGAQPAVQDPQQPTNPPRYQASRSSAVTTEHNEFRIGQQERRRLRAERKRSLEDANASVQQRPKKNSPAVPREDPFFPFRF